MLLLTCMDMILTETAVSVYVILLLFYFIFHFTVHLVTELKEYYSATCPFTLL